MILQFTIENSMKCQNNQKWPIGTWNSKHFEENDLQLTKQKFQQALHVHTNVQSTVVSKKDISSWA